MTGHGEEDVLNILEEPPILMEPGKTLVMFTECGGVTRESHDDNFLTAFSEKDTVELLRDPVKNKAAIEAKIGLPMRIYTEGMEIPRVELEMFTFWKDPNRANKAGVYKSPIAKEDFTTIALGERLTPENITHMYKDSIVPTEEHAQEWFKRNKYQLYWTFPKIVTKFMPLPGIYYWRGCRGIPFHSRPQMDHAIIPPISKPDIFETLVEQSEAVYAIASDETRSPEERDAAVKANEAIKQLSDTILARRAVSTERQRRFKVGGKTRKGGRRRKTRKGRKGIFTPRN